MRKEPIYYIHFGGAMKFQVNINKISLSPNSEIDFISNVDIEYSLTQLKSQLQNSRNSSFLVSGYRGSGKTTLIKKLISSYDDNKCVFVELNFTKYEKLSIVLRKLIRELYLSIEKANKFDDIEDEKLVEQIKLLYDHTFFEISTFSNLTKLREHSLEISTTFKLKEFIKSLVPSVTVFLAGLNLEFNLLPFITRNLDWILFIASIIWLLISSTTFSKKFKNNNSKIEEDTRKSLYDDEIAEYHLKSVLQSLNDKNFKVIFVFDELDKIEDSDDMLNLISDLKPLLLSNLASFIVISGQKMYYKLQSSNLLDDSLLSSIFSKNIHVPLVDENDLDKFFDEILVDKTMLNEKMVRTYKKSAILNSNGTLRRFINRLLQDVTWIKDKAFIEIEDSNATKYETDSKILSVLNSTVERQIDINDYDVGIRDFLIYQLYIWIKKMKMKGNFDFTISEIFNFDNDYSDDYHMWYEVELSELCNMFVSKLVSEKLLEEKTTEDERYFRWVSTADVSMSSLINEYSNSKYQYLREFVEIEELSRELLNDLNIQIGIRDNPLKRTIEVLVNNSIVSKRWMNDEYMDYINLNNKIRHGEKITDIDMNRISVSKSKSIHMKMELIEGYSTYVLSKVLSSRNYEVVRNQRLSNRESLFEFDIIAKHNEKADIIFEIKYWRVLRTTEIIRIYEKLVSRVKDYNQITNKANNLVLLIYSSEVNERIIAKMNERNKNLMLNDMSMKTRVLIVSRNGKVFDSKRIIEFIESYEAQ